MRQRGKLTASIGERKKSSTAISEDSDGAVAGVTLRYGTLDEELLQYREALNSGGYVIGIQHASSRGTPRAPARGNADNVQYARSYFDAAIVS
jgi:hypothetical protein